MTTDGPIDDDGALVAALAGDALIRLCAWCNRHAVGGRWSSTGDEARLLRYLGPHKLTHTICDACFADLRERGLSH